MYIATFLITTLEELWDKGVLMIDDRILKGATTLNTYMIFRLSSGASGKMGWDLRNQLGRQIVPQWALWTLLISIASFLLEQLTDESKDTKD